MDVKNNLKTVKTSSFKFKKIKNSVCGSEVVHDGHRTQQSLQLRSAQSQAEERRRRSKGKRMKESAEPGSREICEGRLGTWNAHQHAPLHNTRQGEEERPRSMH